MKKRLLALALSVSALCSCALVGCNEESGSKTPSGGKALGRVRNGGGAD